MTFTMFVILTYSDLSFIKAAHSSPIKTISHSSDLSEFFLLLIKKDDRLILGLRSKLVP